MAPKELVERPLGAGVVGCNLEDSDPATSELKDPSQQADWLAAVREAAGAELVINARVDVFLTGVRGTAAEAIARGCRYREAGADCVYPILAPAEDLPELAAGIGAPINALYVPGGASLARLGELGASRITFGGGRHKQATAEVKILARDLAVSAG